MSRSGSNSNLLKRRSKLIGEVFSTEGDLRKALSGVYYITELQKAALEADIPLESFAQLGNSAQNVSFLAAREIAATLKSISSPNAAR
jgi:hypothetical protein